MYVCKSFVDLYLDLINLILSSLVRFDVSIDIVVLNLNYEEFYPLPLMNQSRFNWE